MYERDSRAGSTSSCKSMFVAALVKELHATGHRTLIFSQSRVMLDMLGAELDQQRLQFLRIDGTLSAAKREVQICSPATLGSPSYRPCGSMCVYDATHNRVGNSTWGEHGGSQWSWTECSS